MEDLEAMLRGMARAAVRLELCGGDGKAVGRFGGAPDVPAGFVWPVFETKTFYDNGVKPRPLAFLAQFDCAALAEFDPEGLLPHEGQLSFFYELDSQRWGFDPGDAGCARVYWHRGVLAPAELPVDLPDYCRFPRLDIRARGETSYPDFQDFSLAHPGITHPARWEQVRGGWEDFCDGYEETAGRLRGGEKTAGGRLLGWPDVIQNNMTMECELVSRGHYLGSKWETVTPEEKEEAARTSPEGWLLLFQLDSFQSGDFELDFGDCGSVYFYIRREDLAARRFDRVWLILQCF